MMLGGLQIMYALYGPIFASLKPENEMQSEFLTYGIYYIAFIIPISLCLLYMYLTRKEKLKIFTKGGFRKSFCAMLIGFLVGFGTNALISLLAGVSGTVHYSFNTFSWYVPALLLPAFIQCSCEEVLLRAYAAPYMEDQNHWSAAAFISGSLFIFHHIGNLDIYGYDSRFCLNVFLIGVFLYLLTKATDNFWSCCGFHTAWNVTQMYLFGLANSGMSSNIALYQGLDAKDSFFYNTVYGNEGSWCTAVVIGIAIIVALYIWQKQKENKQTV